MGKGGAKDRVAEVGAAPRLRGPAASVGCGADVRLVVPQPQDEQGLREAVRHQRGIRLCGDGTLDGEAVGSCLGISKQSLKINSQKFGVASDPPSSYPSTPEETAKLCWAAHASNKTSSIRFLEELQSGGAAQLVREGCEDLYRLTRCFARAPLDC